MTKDTVQVNRDVLVQVLEVLVRASSYYDTYEEIEALSAVLARQTEPVEPVAKVELMMTGGNAGLSTRIVEIDDHFRERLRPGQLLFTAPPQRKPLTEEYRPKSWAELEQKYQSGCAHCTHPQYVGIRCNVCGRWTEKT